MRPFVLVGVLALLLGGCATSTVETRKQERLSAYNSLPVEGRSLVDEGKIQVGMPMDAVYIAWGKPSQVLEHQSPAGVVVTWLYHGTHLQEHRYWSYQPYHYGDRHYYQPYLAHDYEPQEYVAAEVHFENGVIQDWRTLPRPVR